MSTVRPLADRVLVKKDEVEEVTTSGIILAPDAREETYRGIVVAVGSGKTCENGTTMPPIVSVGDRVIYHQYAGSHEPEPGLLIVREQDLLAVVE